MFTLYATRLHNLPDTQLPDPIVVPYELYKLYDWGKVPELYGTL